MFQKDDMIHSKVYTSSLFFFDSFFHLTPPNNPSPLLQNLVNILRHQRPTTPPNQPIRNILQLLPHIPHLLKPRRPIIPHQPLMLKLRIVNRQKLHLLAPALLPVQQAHVGDQQARSQERPPSFEFGIGRVSPRREEGRFENFHFVGVEDFAGRADEALDVAEDLIGGGFGGGDAAVAGAEGGEGEGDAVVVGEGGYFFDVGYGRGEGR